MVHPPISSVKGHTGPFTCRWTERVHPILHAPGPYQWLQDALPACAWWTPARLHMVRTAGRLSFPTSLVNVAYDSPSWLRLANSPYGSKSYSIYAICGP